MRTKIKRLLKKYHYPPEEELNAMDIVLKQCEQWADVDPEYVYNE
jgi:type I restriction enzyme R subunit